MVQVISSVQVPFCSLRSLNLRFDGGYGERFSAINKGASPICVLSAVDRPANDKCRPWRQKTPNRRQIIDLSLVLFPNGQNWVGTLGIQQGQ